MTMDKITHFDKESWVFLSKILLAGGLAGEVSWLSSYPLDTVKTHIQGNYHIKMTMKQAFHEIYRKHGFK